MDVTISTPAASARLAEEIVDLLVYYMRHGTTAERITAAELIVHVATRGSARDS